MTTKPVKNVEYLTKVCIAFEFYGAKTTKKQRQEFANKTLKQICLEDYFDVKTNAHMEINMMIDQS